MKTVALIYELRASIWTIIKAGCPMWAKYDCLKRLFETAKGSQREVREPLK